MNDLSGPTSTEPIAPAGASLDHPFARPGDLEAGPAGRPPVATFRGRTPPRSEAIRAGVILATGLVVAMGAAVAMGASPSPSPSASGQPGTGPGSLRGNGDGGAPGFGPGGFMPGAGPTFGKFGPGMVFGGGGIGGPEGRGAGRVSVTAISGSSVSLATDDGWTRTISVSGTTTVTKGGAAAKLSDLAVGDTIRFSEHRETDGTYTITAIEIVVPQVAGTVTAVGSDTITITLRDGTAQTIRTTGSTAYHLDQADGKRGDVTVGSTIVAAGAKAGDGTITADSVWIQLPHVGGVVTATASSSITLKRPDGTSLTIHVGSGTVIRVAGVANAKLSDIKTGMVVMVEGTQRPDGSIDATQIGAGERGMPGRAAGGDPGLGRGHGFGSGGGPAGSPSPSAASGSEG